MAEAAGLVLGALGIVGLFKDCVENFDIIIKAQGFSEDFDLLCTQLSLQRIRLVLWGESLGLIPTAAGRRLPYNPNLDRSDIRPAVKDALNHLRLLLSEADVVTGRYQRHDEDAPVVSTPKGLKIFHESFETFTARLRKNQKRQSVWKVTRWAVHDIGKFGTLVTKITSLTDGLHSITASLDVLERQLGRLQDEIRSLSDVESLRLLQAASSSHASSRLLQVVSDTASHRLALVEQPTLSYRIAVPSAQTEGSQSYHTAPSAPRVKLDKKATLNSFDRTKVIRESPHRDSSKAISQNREDDHDTDQPNELVPQNQRLMSQLMMTMPTSPSPQLSFDSGDREYGQALAPIRTENAKLWASKSVDLIYGADANKPLAQRVFLELRSLRQAQVPFITACTVGNSIDKILASIEGPPDTPYEGGIFWVSVRYSASNPSHPPAIRFQIRVYHPNVDSQGNVCAEYRAWWEDPVLSQYMKVATSGSVPSTSACSRVVRRTETFLGPIDSHMRPPSQP